jgi:hypothetical protein
MRRLTKRLGNIGYHLDGLRKLGLKFDPWSGCGFD